MLNIDDRLLDLIPQIGMDAFGILLLIASRIDRENKCFPSRETLQKESGFGRDKVDKALNKLRQAKLISSEQRFVHGRLSSNIYTIHTDYIGVFVSARGQRITENQEQCTENQYTENKEQITEKQCTELPCTENQKPENQTVSIKQSLEVLNNYSEVLNNSLEVLSIEGKRKKSPKFEIPSSEEIVFFLLEEMSFRYTKYKHAAACEKFAERWLSYYQSNGFMVGKNKMKDWKACIRQWLSKDSDSVKEDSSGKMGETFKGILNIFETADKIRRA